MVLVPQREGFGLCGTVPDPLYIAATSDIGSLQRLDFLTANTVDISADTSRSDLMFTLHGGPLPACPGALRSLHAFLVLHKGMSVCSLITDDTGEAALDLRPAVEMINLLSFARLLANLDLFIC